MLIYHDYSAVPLGKKIEEEKDEKTTRMREGEERQRAKGRRRRRRTRHLHPSAFLLLHDSFTSEATKAAVVRHNAPCRRAGYYEKQSAVLGGGWDTKRALAARLNGNASWTSQSSWREELLWMASEWLLLEGMHTPTRNRPD